MNIPCGSSCIFGWLGGASTNGPCQCLAGIRAEQRVPLQRAIQTRRSDAKLGAAVREALDENDSSDVLWMVINPGARVARVLRVIARALREEEQKP